MVGLGAGARSYTSKVHYCTEYAVGRVGIQAILDDFVSRPAGHHASAWYGCKLGPEERKRRYLIKSLLRADGLDEAAYHEWGGSLVMEDFPWLSELLEHELALRQDGVFRLTSTGLEWSDAIGPWLYSDEMKERMDEYELA